MSARMHDEACVVSAGFQLRACDAQTLVAAIRREFEQLNAWCEERGVIVGHVKGFCAWGDSQAAMITTTGGEVQVKGDGVPDGARELDAGMALILFGAPLDEIDQALQQIVGRVFSALGTAYTIEHEAEHHHHEHGEDCDCGCHDHNHDHEHHHHHDENCGCGCHDHTHEHHHG